MKKILLSLPEDVTKKLEELAPEFGTVKVTGEVNTSYTIRAAIAFAHRKHFPDYVTTRKSIPRDPEQIAAARIAVEEAREKVRNDKLTDRWTAICLSMDGAEVIPDPNNEGKMVCHYISYGMNGPHKVDETEMFDPLSAMNEETPILQYHDYLGKTGPAAKERVLKVLKAKTKTK